MKQNKGRGKVQRAVLSTVYAAGAISLAALAPNALKILSLADPERNRKFPDQAIDKARRLLLSQGKVRLVNVGGVKRLELTEKGFKSIDLLERRDFILDSPGRWDRKWRVVVFDISEKRKRMRSRLREVLKGIGFLRLQDSVWIYPYPCEKQIVLIKTEFRLGKNLLYLICESVEHDMWLRKAFKL